MRFDVKQAIIDRLRATKRKNIERVVDYMEKHGFFSYHCHRHHHYDGGLADHAWQTYQIAQRLDAERCANDPNAQKLDEDSIAIAALLHDLCNCSGLRDIFGHGRRSAKILKEIGFKLTQEEFLAIRFHMSLRGKESHPLYDDAKRSQLRYIVHKADGISAHLHNGYEDPDAKQDEDDFSSKFVSALKTLGITVVDDESHTEMQQDELEKFLRSSLIEQALNEDRLEDAFKTPICDENGYAEQMPVVWADYGYGQTPDGVKILTKRSAKTASSLYSKYLDEEALVWDSLKQELFVYVPDAECPAVAFKGSSWLCAKKLKTEATIENRDLNIYEVYKEILSKIKG
ncbi:MAG: HD domain-containing protein [Alistipes sp.]|nr:HD domain-containing protein [Alistipes sp.]